MGILPEDMKDLKANRLVEYSNQLGKKFSGRKNEVTTSQLRGVFSDIKRIQLQWEKGKVDEEELLTKLQLLKPRLAYAVGKASKQKGISGLKTELENAIDGVVNSGDKKKAADNFFKFVEAVVAYHKYYGGG